MAVLTKLPSMAVVDSLKGSLDFYYWKGIPVCRMWPHWPKRTATPLEKRNQNAFGYATKMWKYLPPYIQDQYKDMAISTPVTGRDIFMRAYINASRV